MNANARRLRLMAQIDQFILQTSWEVYNFYWDSDTLKLWEFRDILNELTTSTEETP
jgi:hypothetical protein